MSRPTCCRLRLCHICHCSHPPHCDPAASIFLPLATCSRCPHAIPSCGSGHTFDRKKQRTVRRFRRPRHTAWAVEDTRPMTREATYGSSSSPLQPTRHFSTHSSLVMARASGRCPTTVDRGALCLDHQAFHWESAISCEGGILGKILGRLLPPPSCAKNGIPGWQTRGEAFEGNDRSPGGGS